MHWLLMDKQTPQALEAAGYNYDATAGYNELPGYRAGTTQVYRPPGATQLLELPLHIQDGALFYAKRLDLTDTDAWRLCHNMIEHAASAGGVLTLLWHDRSHGPERFWGDFYCRLLGELRKMPVWFATALDVVDWFRSRRAVTFRRTPAGICATRIGARPSHPFVLRVHRPGSEKPADVSWHGDTDADLSRFGMGSPADFSPATTLAN
jgi:hypothetical protein